jgi:DNA polymerase II large subunit
MREFLRVWAENAHSAYIEQFWGHICRTFLRQQNSKKNCKSTFGEMPLNGMPFDK